MIDMDTIDMDTWRMIWRLKKQVWFLIGYSGLDEDEEKWARYAEKYDWELRPE